MEWSISTGNLLEADVDAILTPIGENGANGDISGRVDAALNGGLARLLADTRFTGKHGTVRSVYTFNQLGARLLTLVGTGAGDEAPDRWRALAAQAAKSARDAGATSLAVQVPPGETSTMVRHIVEGILLGTYRYTHYKTEKATDKQLTKVQIHVTPGEEDTAGAAVAAAEAVADGVAFARDLGNQPGADLWPERLAAIAANMADEHGLRCRIYAGEELAAMGAGALLGVGLGSDRGPRLVHLRYVPEGVDDTAPIAFVGKGITFDTGGYTIKSSAGMETMKIDMAGAAAVLGAMQAIAKLKPAVAIDAIVATAENMVSGRAMRLGDVLTAMNGTTIEVNNTDAEGRLVLADAVTFACKNGAREIIDLATLTGACVVALGTVCTGVMGNQQALVDRLLDRSRAAGERMWQLPLYDEYREVLRSDVADMRNSGGRNAGAQVGAAFIKDFVGTTPWVHLDIAGTAWADKETPLGPKGATGVGVRTLVAFAEAAANATASPRPN